MNASINAGYRYTGKERDEETGLYYHGARYYIPWLCRWVDCDPLEVKYAGMSAYNYGFNNPIKWQDENGMDPDETKQPTTGVREQHNDKGYTGEPEPATKLEEVVITAQKNGGSGSGKWLDISGISANRFEYSDEQFSDPENYVKFVDNVGIQLYNGAVGLLNGVINAEATAKDAINYFSEISNYVSNTPLAQQGTDLLNDFGNMLSSIETYENVAGLLLTKKLATTEATAAKNSPKIAANIADDVALNKSIITRSDATGGNIIKVENSPYLIVEKGDITYHISPDRVKEYIKNPANPNSRWGDQINFKKYGVPEGSEIIKGAGKGHKRTPTQGEINMYNQLFKK